MTNTSARRRTASLAFFVLLVIVLILVFATSPQAQVLSDPRIAEFDPSPDHWTVLDGGQPAVLRYDLDMYVIGAATPFVTVNMGKPAPEADGKIRYDFTSAVAGVTFPGGSYEARVNAVGPEGAALSDPSNPFTFTDPGGCSFSLDTTTVRAVASGGTYSVRVSTGATCDWTATTGLAWVTLWATGGTGSGNVPFAVQANTSTFGRTGYVTVGGQAVMVAQDGAPAPPAKTTPTLTWPAPAPLAEGSALSAAQLNATANVPGTFAYAPPAGTVLAAGTYTLSVTFTPADTVLYTTASASTSLTVVAGSAPQPPPAGDGNLPIGAPYTLSIARPSGGLVKGTTINCGTTAKACSATMPGPMTMTLQARADRGYVFVAWTGHCSGAGASYALALEGPRSCGATFAPGR